MVFIDLKRRGESARETERLKNLSEESLRNLLLPFCRVCARQTIAPMIPRKIERERERERVNELELGNGKWEFALRSEREREFREWGGF